MHEIITVNNAKCATGRTLELTFSDGVTAEIDFSGWIESFPFFEPLKDDQYFKSFSLDGWTVCWPNGADIAPETLYEIAVKSQQLQAA